MKIRSRSPLRLGLAGGGTDLEDYYVKYTGHVLNSTINQYTYCTIIPTSDRQITFISNDLTNEISVKSCENLAINHKSKLQQAVYNRIVQDYTKKPLSLKLFTFSDAPPGSGLGGSSSLVVAMIKAYSEWLDLSLEKEEIATLAYNIERKDLNLDGGKQDQYAATYGGINFIQFMSNKTFVYPVNLPSSKLNELESSIFLGYSGISRDSNKIISDQNKSLKKNNKSTLEAMHSLKEDADKIYDTLLYGSIHEIASIIRESWVNKQKTSNKITNSLINNIIDFAYSNGALACKVSGAGGGGYILFMCDPINKANLIKALRNVNISIVKFSFTKHGVESWKVMT